jgi:glucosamine--fructose-6-phosphate aminotransferase (isomerizing)
MCGIVGYVGQRSVQEILLAGLEKLEYRGYDSAGISIQSEGAGRVRAVGNLSRAEGRVARPRRTAASPCSRRRPRPASATRAGPRTAA